MFDSPLWFQVLIALLALAAALRPSAEHAAPVSRPPRESEDTLWRRYFAVDSIQRSQSRRFAEMDATLGVIAVLEVTAALWFLDNSHHAGPSAMPNVGPLVIGWCMVLPVLCAVAAMRFLNGRESPDASEFLAALDEDERTALSSATAKMAEAFSRNQVRLRIKDFAVSLSLGLFGLLLLADLLGHMVHWW